MFFAPLGRPLIRAAPIVCVSVEQTAPKCAGTTDTGEVVEQFATSPSTFGCYNVISSQNVKHAWCSKIDFCHIRSIMTFFDDLRLRERPDANTSLAVHRISAMSGAPASLSSERAH
jgi:hypothetical protein